MTWVLPAPVRVIFRSFPLASGLSRKANRASISVLNAVTSMFEEAADSQLYFPSTAELDGNADGAEGGTLSGTDGAGYAQPIGDGFSTIRWACGFTDRSGHDELLKLLSMR